MRCCFLVAVAWLAAASPSPAQVMLNQIDTFETGIANWQNGAGLASVQTGGPAGPADHFLRLATTGASLGPGSLMVGFNQAQWLGDYVAQGITAVEMDLKNINYPNAGAGMSVRIVFRTGIAGASTPAYVSNAVTVLADNQWHHAVFFLNAANFTPAGTPPPPPFADILAGGVADFRIVHNPIADPIGGSTAPIAAQLGIDNIQATGIPEPASIMLGGLAAAALAATRFRAKPNRHLA